MKRYYFQIILVYCLTLFAGCSDADSEVGQNGIPKVQERLTCNKTEAAFYVILAWAGDFMMMPPVM